MNAAQGMSLKFEDTDEGRERRERLGFLGRENAVEALHNAGVFRPRKKSQFILARAILEADLSQFGIGVEQDAVERAVVYEVIRADAEMVHDPALRVPGTLFVHAASMADYVAPAPGARSLCVHEEDVLTVLPDLADAKEFFAKLDEHADAMRRKNLGLED